MAYSKLALRTLLTLLLLLLLGGVAAAGDQVIVPEPMKGKKVRIDGRLREWPASFAPLSVTLKGSLKASGMVGYDDDHLYVAVKTNDEKIARSRGAGSYEDHATLYLAFPKGRGFRSHKVQIYPGDPGKLPALVKVDGRPLKTAKAVEAPIEGGLVIEAQLPWSTFPESKKIRVGLKAALRYHDASRPGALTNLVATSAKTGSTMPDLPFESEEGLRLALVKGKGLSERPSRQAFGNVFGSDLVERVAVYGPYISVVGPGYRGGKEFYYGELGTRKASDLRRLELIDFSGDGRAEIVIEKRVGSDDKYRQVLVVFQMDDNGVPKVVFAHEVSIVNGKLTIINDVEISSQGITVAQGKTKGVDPGDYQEPLPPDMPSALLPWEEVKSRTFSWKGEGLTEAGEKTWKPKMKNPGATIRRADSGNATVPQATEIKAPPPPRPPSPDEMLERVYTLYKKDRGVGRSKPRFDFVTDVAGDETTERVLVHAKDIVVFGKGFREGKSYAFLSMGFESDKDVADATARDLNGDGKAEIIVRGVVRAKASKALGGDTIERYALYIYQVQGEKLARIFAAETGRALGDNRIVGSLLLTPEKRGVSIQLGAARALGWTEKTYPFPEDTTAAGGLEPLALPWGTLGRRSYRFDGDRFVLQ